MGTIDGFLEILEYDQLEWFQRQSQAKQAALAAQWRPGSGMSPEDIIEKNGGPAVRGRNALPDIQ
ncbi:hypothetical protein [Streptomyces laurentii]|uniref:hypothetical protein n=1 Tax=Streptomyces laurentii TaxID=39478 RepID=UPI00367F7F15